MKEIDKNKNSLEIEKIQLEIKKLQKAWYKNPDYLKIIVPVFFGIVSLIYAFSSGLIDRQKIDLQITKKKLEYEIQQFNNKKDSLSYINNELEKNISLLTHNNKNLISQTDTLKSVINNKIMELKILNVRMNEKKKIEYKLICDINYHEIENSLSFINGRIWIEGLKYFRKLDDEYYNSEEYKEYKKKINMKSNLTELQKLDAYQYEYTNTEHYQKNKNRYLSFLLKLRDSLFDIKVKNKLKKCNNFIIGSPVPMRPYVKLFDVRVGKYKPKESMILSDSVSLYIKKK